MSESLSLWQIDETVQSLMDLREEEGITDEERAAIDEQLAAWIEREVAKVDRVRGYLKHAEMMERAAREEAAVQRARAEIWAGRTARLKEMCLAIMGRRGAKRLEGSTGVLRAQANGGKRALTITRPDLVPDEYKYVEFPIPVRLWNRIVASFGEKWTPEPQRLIDLIAVRKALDSKCSACGGNGFDREARTLEPTDQQCLVCNGTGCTLVPGAELAPRGEHLVIG